LPGLTEGDAVGLRVTGRGDGAKVDGLSVGTRDGLVVDGLTVGLTVGAAVVAVGLLGVAVEGTAVGVLVGAADEVSRRQEKDVGCDKTQSPSL
jgi:hypothetical protein